MSRNEFLPLAKDEAADKILRFDQLMFDAKFQFEFWAKQHHEGGPLMHDYFAGQAHAWMKVLWYGGITAKCPCAKCTQERNDQNEVTVAALSDRQQCEQIGESNG